MNILNLKSFNTGLHYGKGGYHINRRIISDGDDSHTIIGFQELLGDNFRSLTGRGYKVARNLDLNDNKRSNKSNQLVTAYSQEYELIKEVTTNDRLQIIFFKDKVTGSEFFFINCHIPQKVEIRNLLLSVLTGFLDYFIKYFPIFIVGDFNATYDKICPFFPKEITTYFSRNESTTNRGAIDFILFSEDYVNKVFPHIIDSIDNGLWMGNHLIISQKFLILDRRYIIKKVDQLEYIYNTIKSYNSLGYQDVYYSPNNQRNTKSVVDRFLESNPPNELINAIYKLYIGTGCERIDIRSFKRFVQCKGQGSKNKTVLFSEKAIAFFFNQNHYKLH